MDPPRSSLCPGYKHVSAFSPSLSSPKSKSTLQAEFETNNLSSADAKAAEEDVDYEEEVEYVVLDLGNVEPTLVPSSSTYRLIGLDTPTPFLQLSGTILRGRHDNLLGSELIFSDDKDSSFTPSGQKKRGVTHVTITSKRIAFKEVQLRPKENVSAPVSAEALTRIGKSAGLEQERLEDIDDNMDVDDVDMNIDPVLREPRHQAQAGPSRSNFPSVHSSLISIAAGEGRPTNNTSSISNVEALSGEPALQIERLTGISSPLTRTPRPVKTAPFVLSTATAKGKQKQKEATVDLVADKSGMDTNEGP